MFSMRLFTHTRKVVVLGSLVAAAAGCNGPPTFQGLNSDGLVAVELGDQENPQLPCEPGQEFCEPAPSPSPSVIPPGDGDPNPPGGDPDPNPSPSGDPDPNPSGDPDPNPSGNPDPNPSGNPDPNPSGNPDPNPSGNPDPNPSGNPDPNPSGNPDPNPSPSGNPPGGNDPASYPCPASYHCGNTEKGCMLICHVPPGNPAAAQTQCLPTPAAVNGHNVFGAASKKHADYPGACQ
jgi:hypothetical protein